MYLEKLTCVFGRNSYFKCMKCTVSEKGQVTIPKSLRESLGLKLGTILNFHEENGKIVAEKVIATDPVSAWQGRCQIPNGASVKSYLNTLRENPAA
jgi:AbrB family looped-hinge helix DNA binding protein